MRNFIVMVRNRCLFSLSLESRNVTLKGPRAVSLKQENPRVIIGFLTLGFLLVSLQGQDFYIGFLTPGYFVVFFPRACIGFLLPGFSFFIGFLTSGFFIGFLPQRFYWFSSPRVFIGFLPPGFLLVFLL